MDPSSVCFSEESLRVRTARKPCWGAMLTRDVMTITLVDVQPTLNANPGSNFCFWWREMRHTEFVVNFEAVLEASFEAFVEAGCLGVGRSLSVKAGLACVVVWVCMVFLVALVRRETCVRCLLRGCASGDVARCWCKPASVSRPSRFTVELTIESVACFERCVCVCD